MGSGRGAAALDEFHCPDGARWIGLHGTKLVGTLVVVTLMFFIEAGRRIPVT